MFYSEADKIGKIIMSSHPRFQRLNAFESVLHSKFLGIQAYPFQSAKRKKTTGDEKESIKYLDDSAL